MNRQELPVWYFIGWLLLAYGVILTVAGVDQFFHPPATVLAEYHATFWAGLVLLLLGGTYVLAFRPETSVKAAKRAQAPGGIAAEEALLTL